MKILEAWEIIELTWTGSNQSIIDAIAASLESSANAVCHHCISFTYNTKISYNRIREKDQNLEFNSNFYDIYLSELLKLRE